MKPQPLTDTFIEAVHYIYYNRRQLERVVIDKHLLSLDLDPAEIDWAWQAIQGKLGWAIMQEAGKPFHKRRMPGRISQAYAATFNPEIPTQTPSSSRIYARISLFIFLNLVSFYGFMFLAAGQDFEMPGILIFGFGGVIVNSVILLFNWRTSGRNNKLQWLGPSLIAAEVIIIFSGVALALVPPGPPAPFAPYPNATRLTLPAEDTIKDFHGFAITCFDSMLSLAEIYASNTSAEAISNFYTNQAKTIGNHGLELIPADNFFGINPVVDANCYLGRHVRHTYAANGIAYLAIASNRDGVEKFFPALPSDANYLIFVFNGLLYTI